MGHEMSWTVLWFDNQRMKWVGWAKLSEERGQAGHACYAWKQVDMWETMRKEAERSFAGDMVKL